MKRIFEEFWHFATRENGAISGINRALQFSVEKQIQQWTTSLESEQYHNYGRK